MSDTHAELHFAKQEKDRLLSHIKVLNAKIAVLQDTLKEILNANIEMKAGLKLVDDQMKEYENQLKALKDKYETRHVSSEKDSNLEKEKIVSES